MEENEMMNVDVIEDVAEATTGKGKLKTISKVGLIGIASIAAWDLIKPIGRKVRAKIAAKRAAKHKKAKTEDIDIDNLEVDDLPNIDD